MKGFKEAEEGLWTHPRGQVEERGKDVTVNRLVSVFLFFLLSPG